MRIAPTPKFHVNGFRQIRHSDHKEYRAGEHFRGRILSEIIKGDTEWSKYFVALNIMLTKQCLQYSQHSAQCSLIDNMATRVWIV